MKNLTLRTTTILALAAGMLLNGCDALIDDEVDSPVENIFDGGNSGSSTSSSSLSVQRKGEKDFIITWKRSSGGYGEVIYTDDLSKKRGNGYPLTSNTSGTFTLDCTFKAEGYDGSAGYICQPSNVTYTKGVSLKNGVEYYWLVSDGFDHDHGEVEATMTYRDGQLIIE